MFHCQSTFIQNLEKRLVPLCHILDINRKLFALLHLFDHRERLFGNLLNRLTASVSFSCIFSQLHMNIHSRLLIDFLYDDQLVLQKFLVPSETVSMQPQTISVRIHHVQNLFSAYLSIPHFSFNLIIFSFC